MAKTKLISIDVSDLERFNADLAGLTPEQLAASTVGAINRVTDDSYDLLRKTILSGINLTDQYVQRKMDVEHATERNPKAEIVAYGGKGYLTSLSHYGQVQETTVVNWTNAMLESMGVDIGPWPKWTWRRGDSARDIPADEKQAGISVEVVRGQRKVIGAKGGRPAFILPGKRDSEGNPLIAKRIPGTRRKVDVLSGPSVYQLAAVAIPKIEDEVAEDLVEAVREAATRQLLETIA